MQFNAPDRKNGLISQSINLKRNEWKFAADNNAHWNAQLASVTELPKQISPERMFVIQDDNDNVNSVNSSEIGALHTIHEISESPIKTNVLYDK